MAQTLSDLNKAVVDNLKQNGKYGQLSAQIRAEIFKILSSESQGANPPPLCQENFLINELIREYLQFNGYSNTLSVFTREAGQPDEPMNREFLAHSLSVIPHKQIPILYTLALPNPPQNISPSQSKATLPPPRPAVNEASDEGFFEIKSEK